MPLELNNKQRKTLRLALIEAFPGYRVLERMVSDQLDENLETISAASNDLETVTYDLIEWAKAHGILAELVMGARAANRGEKKHHGHPDLLKFMRGLGLSASKESTASLEKVVGGNSTFLDVARWRAELERNEYRICRIDRDGKGKGTGFLVGPNLVLTNYHVVMSAIKGERKPSSFTCRFDYKVTEDGSVIENGKVEELADDWLIDHAKHSKVDTEEDPKSGDPDDDELDYALLRLANDVGDEAPRGGGDAEERGWINLSTEAIEFDHQRVVGILQHPSTLPLKLALGFEQQLKVNGAGNRIRHTVPTEPGSSGSPLFNGDWQLVALHHSGDPKKIKPEFNEAIPIALIAARPKVAEALPKED